MASGRTERDGWSYASLRPDVRSLLEAHSVRCNVIKQSVAKLAEIPNPATVRDIEYGRDAKLSNIEAIATALGLRRLRLELVEQNV